jgi:hypothetical protein
MYDLRYEKQEESVDGKITIAYVGKVENLGRLFGGLKPEELGIKFCERVF